MQNCLPGLTVSWSRMLPGITVRSVMSSQVVLRTPYGTFYREEVNGFYSLVTSEPPRWRCNTLDRDTVSRPRMHTVDEGNRRRYTLDRDHINRMINRLSDKLEKRTDIRADVTAHNSSVSSSPLQEEFGCHSSFVPISAAVQRADELMATDAVKDPRMASTGLLAPFPVDEYQDRRRSYSFHLNSQGHASRVKMPKMIDGHCGDVVAGSQHLPSAQTTCRRSSVGTVSGLHASKRSCPLVSRTQPHRLVTVDGMGGNSTEKASWIALPAFEVSRILSMACLFSLGQRSPSDVFFSLLCTNHLIFTVMFCCS